ncbi:MAG: hypothetical protein EAZ09_19720, partial [Oscillatoriales cyanobacterium]
RYLGHDTGECDASFPLYHLQLNSFKVTETVLQVKKAFITRSKRTLPRKGERGNHTSLLGATIPLQPRKGIQGG